METRLQVQTHRFTVEEYYRMAEAGIFHEDDRVELIEGEIVDMVPIGSGHAASVARLTKQFTSMVGNDLLVWVQNPVRLGEHSEPEPDLALLKPRDDFYASAHPGPQDVLLIVEVAETSLAYDRDVKLPLYAQHGVPEVWLVDLKNGRVHVYRKPSADSYKEHLEVRGDDPLSAVALHDIALTAKDVLG